jgi:hypothetical protein
MSIEAVIIETLRENATLAGTVSTYVGVTPNIPAIFADEAPENAEMPFIVIEVSNMQGTPGSVILAGNLDVHYFDRVKSRVLSDLALETIEVLIDKMKFTGSPRFSEFRATMRVNGYIPDADSRDIHHVSTFDIRAVRSKWIDDRNVN